MGASAVEQLAPAWASRAVVTYEGARDTNIQTGEDYATRTLASIFTMEPVERPKDRSPAFIPSLYHDFNARDFGVQRRRGQYVALTLDVDNGDHSLERIETLVKAFAGGCAWLIYSSVHSRPGDRRWRAILPLDEPAPYEAWHDAQQALFRYMEDAGVVVDWALSRAAQTVYLPNVPRNHERTGTALRDSDGRTLYFERASSALNAPGLRLDVGLVAEWLATILRERAEDDARRASIRAEAERRRSVRSPSQDGSLIDSFNEDTSLPTMLERCGYERDPRRPDHWRSPLQQGHTFATMVVDGGKWISLSASDVNAGLGEKCDAGCFGDAFDLFVHFEHGGDRSAAFRALAAERRASASAARQDPPSYLTEHAPPLESYDPGPEEVESRASRPIDRPTAPLDWARPVDLWARYEAPPLPRGLLPPVVEAFATRHGEMMGVDPAGLAMAALAVCAAATPDRIKLQVKVNDPTWREPARLWVALIGAPSTKKSPIIGAAVRPLAQVDTKLFGEYVARQQAYQALPSAERKQIAPPPQKRLRLQDTTVEAAQDVLKDSPDGVLSVQDELSGWFGAMDKYAAGKGAMADRGFWLQSYNGGAYALNRVSRGASLIPNLSISVLGGIQPEPLRQIVGDSVDDGLIQRLLPVILRPADLDRDEPQDGSVDRYEGLVKRLTELKPPRSANERDGYLIFDKEAQDVRNALAEKHRALTDVETVSPKLAAHFGKYDGLFARLCVLWHCIEHADKPEMPVAISGETARRVADFLHGYIAPSSVAFYTGVLRLSDDHEQLIELASYILSQRLETVQHRDCQRGSRTLKGLTQNQTRVLFEKLESFSWLEPIDPPKNSRTPRWAVNPAVFELFEDRGRRERERRQKARAALISVLRAE